MTSYAERATILEKIAAIIESRLDEFAEAESRDQGKPVSLAKAVDIPRVILLALLPLFILGGLLLASVRGAPEQPRTSAE